MAIKRMHAVVRQLYIDTHMFNMCKNLCPQDVHTKCTTYRVYIYGYHMYTCIYIYIHTDVAWRDVHVHCHISYNMSPGSRVHHGAL